MSNSTDKELDKLATGFEKSDWCFAKEDLINYINNAVVAALESLPTSHNAIDYGIAIEERIEALTKKGHKQ